MRLRALRPWFLAAGFVAAFAACSARSSSATVESWDYSFKDIIPPREAPSSSIAVDLYLDSTVSMQGFVGFPESALSTFIRDLEGSIGSGWSTAAVHYFKFGSRVVEWPRDKFIVGISSPQFYSEKGVAETTNIDALMAKADPSHISLVVTDLFQNEGDVNAMVAAIKQGFVNKGIPLGIMPVPSQFSGTVYDAKVPPYKYASRTADASSYRAFYLLMFGKEADIERLIEILAQASKVDRTQVLLLTQFPVRRQHVAVLRESLSKELVELKIAKPNPNEVALDVRGDADATLRLDVAIDQNPAAPPIALDRLEVSIVRRAPARRSGEASSEERMPADLRVDGALAYSAGRVRVPLRLRIADPPGTYYYRIDLRTPSVNAFHLPAWVATWSTDNPTPASDPNKTINLSRFLNGLVQASASTHQMPVARGFLRIRKK